MKEIKGDIWDYYDKGNWIVITTNGDVRKDGACVMGRGIALQAKLRFPELPYRLGKLLKEFGNSINYLWPYRIIAFPVKSHWRGKANLRLIERSCEDLLFSRKDYKGSIYMVRPGCGNGGLDWDGVKSILEKYLDDRFVVVSK